MEKQRIHRRVLKLGGSLLTLDDWHVRLRQWQGLQTPAEDLLVVGGGRLADVVRELDAQRRVDELEAHWMCVAAMTINASRVAEVLDARMTTASEIRSSAPQEGLRVVDPWRFLREEDATFSGDALPIGWHVTSDSIAARVAQVVAAETLVLFKSCEPSSEDSIAMAAAGYVDEYFPRASAMIRRVVCVDLRNESHGAHRDARRLAAG